jgi:hypothetical protein
MASIVRARLHWLSTTNVFPRLITLSIVLYTTSAWAVLSSIRTFAARPALILADRSNLVPTL